MLLLLLDLVWLCWATAVICVLGAITIPALQPVLKYGKLQAASTPGLIPQALFWPSIYTIGLVVNSIFAILLLTWISSPVSYVLMLLYFIHLIRRFAETLVVHKFSNRFVSPLQALLGVAYYVGAVAAPQIEELARPHHLPSTPLLVVGIALFGWSNYEQFTAHRMLAALRTRPGAFGVPHGRFFKFVSCPHYAAEVLIYVALVLVSGARNYSLLLILVFVTLTLCNAAVHTHTWYKQRFAHYPKQRAAILPAIL